MPAVRAADRYLISFPLNLDTSRSTRQAPYEALCGADAFAIATANFSNDHPTDLVFDHATKHDTHLKSARDVAILGARARAAGAAAWSGAGDRMMLQEVDFRDMKGPRSLQRESRLREMLGMNFHPTSTSHAARSSYEDVGFERESEARE